MSTKTKTKTEKATDTTTKENQSVEEMLKSAKQAVENMLEDAKKQADEIINRANNSVNNEAKENSIKAISTSKPRATLSPELLEKESKLKEHVTIKLRKDRNNPKPDLFVAVNGKTFQIKRGVEVKVPLYVAQVIADSDAQEEFATDFMDGLVYDYAEKSKAID